jgi:calcineurin-like phosphoesterase family protein
LSFFRPSLSKLGLVRNVFLTVAIGLLFLIANWSVPAVPDTGSPFLVRPYVQTGDSPQNLPKEQIFIFWHAPPNLDGWAVEYREKSNAAWRTASDLHSETISVLTIAAHSMWSAVLPDLTPGAEVEYRILLQGTTVFEASTRARKTLRQATRFVVVGDVGTDSTGTREVAFQIYRNNPDFIVIPGDIAYSRGTISDYRAKFYPYWNADSASLSKGAPILRSIPVYAGLGEHDTSYLWYMIPPENKEALYDEFANLNAYPDSLAYFLYWCFPLNGPVRSTSSSNSYQLRGEPRVVDEFLRASKPRFPVMANYSFEYGETHWAILDTWNPSADWNSAELRRWLDTHLASTGSQWRFAAIYSPPFHSYRGPAWQKMRAVADLLEKQNVTIAFSGCWHSYQWTTPLRFRVSDKAGRQPANGIRTAIDEKFDGKTETKPDGVIYMVTGAGGALLGAEQTNNPSTWQSFTRRYIADCYSFTVVDVAADVLGIRQVSNTGEIIDSLKISR